MYTQEIYGDLLDVDDQMLKVLDTLEQHPHFYKRIATSCVLEQGDSPDTKLEGTGHSPEAISCEVYLLTNFRPELLSLPRHSCYADDPKQPYVCTTDREDASRDWWHEVKMGY